MPESKYFYKILRKKGVNEIPFGAQEYKDYGYQVHCNVIEVQFVDEVSFDPKSVFACLVWSNISSSTYTCTVYQLNLVFATFNFKKLQYDDWN